MKGKSFSCCWLPASPRAGHPTVVRGRGTIQCPRKPMRTVVLAGGGVVGGRGCGGSNRHRGPLPSRAFHAAHRPPPGLCPRRLRAGPPLAVPIPPLQQQISHLPQFDGHEVEAGVLHRKGPGDAGIGTPRALIFDVRGSLGTASLYEDRGESCGAGAGTGTAASGGDGDGAGAVDVSTATWASSCSTYVQAVALSHRRKRCTAPVAARAPVRCRALIPCVRVLSCRVCV